MLPVPIYSSSSGSVPSVRETTLPNGYEDGNAAITGVAVPLTVTLPPDAPANFPVPPVKTPLRLMLAEFVVKSNSWCRS